MQIGVYQQITSICAFEREIYGVMIILSSEKFKVYMYF